MKPILQVENLTKFFGVLELFHDLNFSIAEKQRVGLIARNGTGKTTLLRIIAGEETSDTGSVIFRNEIRIGYLSQNPILDERISILANVLKGTPEVADAIDEYQHAQKISDDEKLRKASERIEALNAWSVEAQAMKILSQLEINDLSLPVSNLSGGQRKRVALAAVLISNPDFLILDEPTNHLDLPMVEWLEDFLVKAQPTLLMVTHDRVFLDKICNEILEIDNKQLYSYKGNFSYFLEKRQERFDARQANFERAHNLYRRELEWIRRTPSARTSKAKYRIDAFDKIREEAHARIDQSKLKIAVKAERLGKKVLEAKNISKRFDDKIILHNFSYNFRRFERLGIVGNNGTGKSTFLNMLTGQILPDSGDIEVGETIVFGYYKQEGISFNNNEKVIDALRRVAEVVTLHDGQKISVSQFLTHFLFPPSVQNNYIGLLSGGEKRRLYLCTILMKNPNFLILDEPTNDLDIETLQVLEEYLENFPGVILVVSHDRRFLDKVVDGLLIFEGNGEISGFAGNYSDYYSWKQEQQENQPSEKKSKPPYEAKNLKRDYTNRLSYAEKRELEQLTAEIELLEQEKKQLEKLFSSGDINTAKNPTLFTRMGEILELLDFKELRWLELMEKGGDKG